LQPALYFGNDLSTTTISKVVMVVEEEVISQVKNWLRQRPAEWYCEGVQALTSQWCKVIDLEGDCVEK
jgi:hypothetical protein